MQCTMQKCIFINTQAWKPRFAWPLIFPVNVNTLDLEVLIQYTNNMTDKLPSFAWNVSFFYKSQCT